jgi:calcineurin-like phosphoesterase family protein/thrombospondin type 3 repeat protein
MRRNYQRLAAACVIALVVLAVCAPLASAAGSDWDSDGIRNALDNCMKQPNPTQTDLDGDGQGDVCDSDRDGDGQLDTVDPCPDDALDGCVAPPPPDTTPPDTTITAGPAEGGTITEANSTFSFSSSEANSTFSCQLDDGGFSPCASPTTYDSLSNGSHTFGVQATDAAGNTDATPATRTWTVNATTQSDPVFVGAGDIASCSSSGDEATAKLLDGIPGTVYTLGDDAYESGTTTEFANCYDPSWGRHKARTKPAVGNHEYATGTASGYFGYFGAAAGDPSKGYYSYDLGAWHIVALNSMCENVGGCGTSSPMVSWLKGDLAANHSSCTLAYWHHPVFSSGSEHGNDPKMVPSWDALYAAGADVVLSGHDHDYERFAPQTSSGVADPARGIREFVVGTGGRSHYAFGTIRANSQARNSDTYGVLKLTLHASSYDWQFVPEAGKTFSDSGSGSCH